MMLSAVEGRLWAEMGAERMLSGILEPLRERYDYIILDTCPSLGILTINALTAADEVVIEKIKPFHDHPFRLYEGERLGNLVESIREHGILNPVIVRVEKKRI